MNDFISGIIGNLLATLVVVSFIWTVYDKWCGIKIFSFNREGNQMFLRIKNNSKKQYIVYQIKLLLDDYEVIWVSQKFEFHSAQKYGFPHSINFLNYHNKIAKNQNKKPLFNLNSKHFLTDKWKIFIHTNYGLYILEDNEDRYDWSWNFKLQQGLYFYQENSLWSKTLAEIMSGWENVIVEFERLNERLR